MKKIIALLLVLSLSAFCFVGCKKDKDVEPTPETPATQTPVEKTYTLSLAVDDGFSSANGNSNKVSTIALALLTDADGKIVAARFDSVDAVLELNADKTDITNVERFRTKVELGDNYTGMPAGSWQKQAKAFEDFLVGKTAAEVAALDTDDVSSDNPIVAGCTMSNTTPVFQELVAEAFAYTRKVTFKTAEAVTLGFTIDTSLVKTTKKIDDVNTPVAEFVTDFAAVAVAGGKVVAAMLDSADAYYTYSVEEIVQYGNPTVVALATLAEYKGTKNEQGDAYDAWQPMPAGRWYAQAQAYANSAVGKTVAELANLATEGVAGCTIGVDSYKDAIVNAAGKAR